MCTPTVFVFAPIPLTDELSPLAHAAALARRRQAESQLNGKPRHRISAAAHKREPEIAMS